MALRSQQQLNVLSLCTGGAGLDLGLKLAVPAARTVCYVEREAYAVALLVSRIQEKILDSAPIWSDVTTFDGCPWRGIVDIVTAGYPCQPFSSAGRRMAAADPRHIWPSISWIISEVRPRICFFENVANHVNIGFKDVRNNLQELGYRVAAGLYTAAEAGAPHERKRLFILAYADCNQSQRAGKRRELGSSEGRDGQAAKQRQRIRHTAGNRSESMADANSDRWIERWSEQPRQRGSVEVARYGGAVADAARLRYKWSGDTWHARSGFADGGHAVEYPSIARVGQLAAGQSQGPCTEVDTERTSYPVAVVHSAGLHEQGEPGPDDRIFAWPPGPDDRDGWRQYLNRWPGSEPAIRRGADGLADRVDRLRTAGNGVVPVVAALAFIDLWHELHG